MYVRTCFLSPQLGGTIGDIEGMPFIEAFRQFQFKVGLDNFCNIHVSLIPEVSIRPLPFIAWGGGRRLYVIMDIWWHPRPDILQEETMLLSH